MNDDVDPVTMQHQQNGSELLSDINYIYVAI